MDYNHLIGNIMRIVSLPKLLYYKLLWVKIVLFSWAILFWFPKIRWWSNIKIGKDFQLWRYSRLQWKIQIGNNVFLNEFASINATNDEKWEIVFKNNIMCWSLDRGWNNYIKVSNDLR